MTYSQACARFYNLATTGISIGDAIVEAIDRIYEMGRFPGTTVELTLAESDFQFDEDINAYFLLLDDDIYDGAIGFRSDGRGWSIVDQAILYKDGINAGDLEFVDYGTVSLGAVSAEVTGTTSPDISGTYPRGSDFGGYPSYTLGTEGAEGSTSIGRSLDGDVPSDWTIVKIIDLSPVTVASWQGTSVESPDLVTTWTPTGATGNPVVTLVFGRSRKYRAPLGFCPDQGPYYALMKLDAPELLDDTIINVPVGPLKCAVLAVCQEYVGDDDRALLNWQKFDNFMTRSERQTHGPKRWFMGFDSSLRRKPTQFM